MDLSITVPTVNRSDTISTQKDGNEAKAWTVLMVPLAFTIVYYISGVLRYHRQHSCFTDQQLPPLYPHFLPLIGNTLSFIFDNVNFFRHATTYDGKLSSSRIHVFGRDVFLFEDRETVRKLWKSTSLSSPIEFYVHVLRHFFGMPEHGVATYKADNSGPFIKHFPGSNVLAQNRIDHLTHEGFKRAFSGPGLAPMTKRYMVTLEEKLKDLSLSTEWTDMPDFLQFFRMIHGAALLDVVFGPSLTKVNPEFLQDLWQFDDSVPLLARLVPSLLFPGPYRVRKSLHSQFKRWYAYAREHFSDASISEDGYSDPYWGSELIRNQQKMYLQADNLDDDAIAAADLGLVWGTLGNAIPTTMLSVYHVFKDPSLLRRVRGTLEESFGNALVSEIDPRQLVQNTLLSSIQAETLRLYVNVCVMLSSPHTDVSLGRWWMPKGAVGLIHSGITHKDESFWNTKNGTHPVGSFWADRFITDREDPSSGPVRSDVHDPVIRNRDNNDEKSSFSLQGLEASWMPYGGGTAICPGRLLAKRMTLFTIAFMTREFDIELLNESMELGKLKFGMGVDKPKKPIPFRIKKRSVNT